MKLLIKSCKDPMAWYAPLIGCKVPYKGFCSEGYKSRDSSGNFQIVNIEDATVFDEMEANDKAPAH